MLLETTVVVIVTTGSIGCIQALGNVASDNCCGFCYLCLGPIVPVTNKGKVIVQKDANPCKEDNALEIRCKLEGHMFESQCWQMIFSIKCSCTYKFNLVSD